MHKRMHRDGLAIWLTALALAAPAAASPTDAVAAAAEPDLADDELDEVVVTGRRSGYVHQNPQIYFDWLARLVGEFTVEGYVDVSPRGGRRDLLTAEGTVRCIGFGIAPGVQCDLHIRWPERSGAGGEAIPGSAPTLDPATMLFGFKENGYNFQLDEVEISEYSIKHVLVDNKGIFESGHAVHEGDNTVVSRSHCAAVRADCERMVRITANPDLRMVEMLIEVTIEQHKTLSYVLLMNRVPGSKAEVFGRRPEKAKRK